MTGIVYDDNFTVHECLWDENYSECPQRFTSILDRCNSLGLIQRCKKIETRQATKEDLLSKHTVDHVNFLESTENFNDNKLEQISSKYDSVYIHPFTYKQSLLAAGSTIELVKAVVEGRVQNGMALVRPPGHHAMKSEYCGYCFFNNVAIAAQYLLDTKSVQKILIVDWDVHHGQATQQMFYDDPRVLYFSIHRYEHGRFWPNLRESDFDHVGNGNGVGFNVNVPLNDIAMKNEDYMAIIHYLLVPLAIEFSPDLIIVSSGYDSAIGDPKGEMLVTPACYAHMTQKLMSIVHGKVVCILEGGYYLKSLAESAALTLRALLGDPCPVMESLQQPCTSVMETIRNVIFTHKNYWECFKYNILSAKKSEINYNFTIEKPNVYQTRNMYPKIDTTSFDVMLNQIITETKLFKPKEKIGLIYEMIDQSNKSINNDEIQRYLKSHIGNVHVLKERQSTVEELNLVYTTKYINEILKQPNYVDDQTNGNNRNFIKDNPVLDTFCFFVGSLFQIIDSMFNNRIRSGISTFLSTANMIDYKDINYLNASIISANYAIRKHFVKKVVIIELNQNLSQTYCNDEILVISIHKPINNLNTVNSNNINSHNVNISWPKESLNDAEFTMMLQHLILPIIYEYNPELIIISTKFNSNISKNIGIQISSTMYGHLIQWLSTLANGRIILCDQSVHKNVIYSEECLFECFKALLGNPIQKLCLNKLLSLETKQLLRYNIEKHINTWKSLQL